MINKTFKIIIFSLIGLYSLLISIGFCDILLYSFPDWETTHRLLYFIVFLLNLFIIIMVLKNNEKYELKLEKTLLLFWLYITFLTFFVSMFSDLNTLFFVVTRNIFNILFVILLFERIFFLQWKTNNKELKS